MQSTKPEIDILEGDSGETALSSLRFLTCFHVRNAGDGDKNVMDRHRDSVASSDDRLLQRCSPANVGCDP